MVPTAARDVAAVAGALLVLTAAVSVVSTVIIPRKTGSHLTRLVDRVVAVAFRLGEVNFPIERDPAEAWPDFVGWRVNYERAAYAVAAAVYAVPALWSGPRRHPVAPIPPTRPDEGRPPK